MDESSGNCQQITIHTTSYYKQLNKSTSSNSFQKNARSDQSSSSSGSNSKGHFKK